MNRVNRINSASVDDALLDIVRRHPDGLSEWALLQALRAALVPGYEAMDLADAGSLFRSHFLLFNRLYRLDEQLRRESGETIEIHCLRIRLLPAPCGAGASGARLPDAADPLRAYYLDLSNMDGVDAAQVEAMISDFWRRLAQPDDRHRVALDVLGLDPGAGRDQIKRQYRRLVQRHHPDRGGDTGTVQRINEAMMILMEGAGN